VDAEAAGGDGERGWGLGWERDCSPMDEGRGEEVWRLDFSADSGWDWGCLWYFDALASDYRGSEVQGAAVQVIDYHQSFLHCFRLKKCFFLLLVEFENMVSNHYMNSENCEVRRFLRTR
jgi:hypothetical protein